MRRLGMVVAVLCVIVSAVAIGNVASAVGMTTCSDSIVGPDCHYDGLYSKNCCLVDDWGLDRVWNSLTERWWKSGQYYWLNPSETGTWGSRCVASCDTYECY